MLFSKIRLITFDSTGTLLNFSGLPSKKYAQIASLYGVECDHNKLQINFRNYWRKMIKEHPNYGRHSGLGWENWWRQMVLHTFKGCEIPIDDGKLKLIANHLIEEYKQKSCWNVTQGALDLLSYLKHKGVTLGVISNFDPRLHETLLNNKIRHYFRFVVTSYEVGIEKPHPRIFEEAIKASSVKDLKSEECLHIGDSIPLDYVGATRAGWKALVVLSDKSAQNEEDKIDENHKFYSFYELHKYLMDNGETAKKIQY